MNWKVIIGAGVLATLAGGGYALYRFIKNQKELIEDYEIDFIGIKFSDISENLLAGTISFRVTNKSIIEAVVKKLYGDIYLSDAYMGYIRNSKEFLIPRQGSSDIPIDFSFAGKGILRNIVKSILSLFTMGDVSYRVKGFVQIESSGVSVSPEFDYKGLLKSDMFGSAIPVSK